jgi:hypothetical protein
MPRRHKKMTIKSCTGIPFFIASFGCRIIEKCIDSFNNSREKIGKF